MGDSHDFVRKGIRDGFQQQAPSTNHAHQQTSGTDGQALHSHPGKYQKTQSLTVSVSFISDILKILANENRSIGFIACCEQSILIQIMKVNQSCFFYI